MRLKLYFNLHDVPQNLRLRKCIAQLPQNLHLHCAQHNYCGICTYKKWQGGHSLRCLTLRIQQDYHRATHLASQATRVIARRLTTEECP